jgi:(p)ppGpp synthase/HD superfamily hydrolase
MFILNHAISPEDSFEIEKAISYLVTNYNESGHNPKPVILHSLRIANILMEMGYDKKIIIGAVLHDIIEDTNVTDEQLREDFGQDVLDLVIAVSYDESILHPIEQYKDMYDRILAYGKDAVVLKSVDIAVNSLYIDLVPNPDKKQQLVEKGTYFLNHTETFCSEPAWQLLKSRNLEEVKKCHENSSLPS